MINYLPLHSKKKSHKALNTQPNTIIKETTITKNFSYSKSPVQFRSNSPNNTDFAKKVPKSIMYDKETLYMQVHELKTQMNKLKDQNMKLKTKITVAEAEKQRLNKSFQDVDYEERHGYRTFLPRQQSQRKLDNLKLTTIKKQLQELRNENEALKKQNLRIKKTMKYIQHNQLQIQIKVIMEENIKLFKKYEEIRIKFQERQITQKQQKSMEKSMNLVYNQNKKYSTQIEQMHMQIMNLQAELRQQRQYFTSRQKRMALQISEAKRFDGLQGKDITDFKKQNLAYKEANIRSIKAEQRIQHSSFKSHYVHVQPIRRDKIFNVKVGRKLQWDKARVYTEQSKQKRTSSLLRSQEEKIKLEQISLIKDINIISNQTSKSMKQEGVIQKPSNVQTHFTDNFDKDHEKEEIQIHQSKYASLKNLKQINIQQPLPIIKKIPSSSNSVQTDSNPLRIQKFNLIQQVSQIQKNKNTLKNKKPQSQRNFQNEAIEESEEKNHKTQAQKAQSARSKLVRQNINYTPNNAILKEIRTLLTYRFKNQKYTFSDLQKDIKSTSAKAYSFIDICYMLVNEPFYLNVDYCRGATSFIFDKQKPERENFVDSDKLIVKLRKLVRDYEPINGQAETLIIQKCVTVITANREKIEKIVASQKIEEECINIEKFKLIFKQLEMNDNQIQYLIAQASINSNDLQHLAYKVVLERFSIDSDISSKHSVIFQREDEDCSNLDKSNIGQQNQINQKKHHKNSHNSPQVHQLKKSAEKPKSINKNNQKQDNSGIYANDQKLQTIKPLQLSQINKEKQEMPKQITQNIQKQPHLVQKQIENQIVNQIAEKIVMKNQQKLISKGQEKESQQNHKNKQIQQKQISQTIQQKSSGKKQIQITQKIQQKQPIQHQEHISV